MVNFAALAVFLASTSASLFPIERRDDGIVNGTNSSIQDVPYQVQLRLNGTTKCGATILTNDTILTAAHCFDSISSIFQVGVAVGSSNPNAGRAYRVSGVVLHPKYGRTNIPFDYDAAIVKLSSPLAFDRDARPVGRVANFEVDEGTFALVSGYGAIYRNGPSAKTLQSVKVPVLSLSTCQNVYGRHRVTDRMLCAGFPQGGRDACQGDSGGPLVINDTIIGVVSWGDGCAGPRQPGVYANVAHPEILRFIVDNVYGREAK